MNRSAPIPPAGRHLLRAVLACCVVWAAAIPAGRAVEGHSEEAVKAAFIFRFTAYVEWPEEALPQDSFTIAVLGDGSVAERLKALTAGRSLLSRPVQVREISNLAQAKDVQVLFVGRNRRTELRRLLAPVANRRVLVISDEVEGLEAGSAVNFLMADSRLRFEVSLPAAKRAGLKVSSEMLSVAARVQQ